MSIQTCEDDRRQLVEIAEEIDALKRRQEHFLMALRSMCEHNHVIEVATKNTILTRPSGDDDHLLSFRFCLECGIEESPSLNPANTSQPPQFYLITAKPSMRLSGSRSISETEPWLDQLRTALREGRFNKIDAIIASAKKI